MVRIRKTGQIANILFEHLEPIGKVFYLIDQEGNRIQNRNLFCFYGHEIEILSGQLKIFE